MHRTGEIACDHEQGEQATAHERESRAPASEGIVMVRTRACDALFAFFASSRENDFTRRREGAKEETTQRNRT